MLSRRSRLSASIFGGILSTVVVGSLCTIIVVGNLKLGGQALRDASGVDASGRQLLQAESDDPAAKAHRKRLEHVHGWLMCLAWGALIPIGVVIATFRTVRGASAWWFHLHRILNILGLLVSLAGLSVGVYLDPGEGGLTWKHKIIGITVNVLAVVQVSAALLLRPKHTSNLRRVWNLTHWTLGRAALALAIANMFIGMYISSVAYKHIIAQAVVLGGLFIIVMLKNDIEYLMVGCTPAEEEARLRAAHLKGSESLGKTNPQALVNGNGKLNNRHVNSAKGQNGLSTDPSLVSTDPSIFDTNNSVPETHRFAPTNGSETVV
ncbi:hypothetical protein ABBQ38_011505 [Trebouxia sp. C0009 RCD-2024]